MSKKTDKLFLEDMLEAIAKVDRYLSGLNEKNFKSDEKSVDAVIRNMEIIGEAANQLSDDFTSKHPEIEWRKIIGLRNRVVHDYFGIDLDMIWQIIQKDLPILKSNLEKIKSET